MQKNLLVHSPRGLYSVLSLADNIKRVGPILSRRLIPTLRVRLPLRAAA